MNKQEIVEHPIIFSGEMVNAILSDTKTMTRRVNSIGEYYISDKKCPYGVVGDRLWVRETWRVGMREDPYREYKGVQYKADALCPENEKDGLPVWVLPEARDMGISQRWRPSIFMPRRISRITLEVIGVRIERLQDITEEDAEKEGMPDEYPIESVFCPNCQGYGTCGAIHPISLGYMEVDCTECDTAKKKFKNLWNHINGRKPGKTWDDNPWVWAIEFRRVEE